PATTDADTIMAMEPDGIFLSNGPGDPEGVDGVVETVRTLLGQKPVFGICRGFQLMNVYFGGTLYQDINTQLPNSIVHRDAELYDQLNHEIEIGSSSILGELYGKENVLSVNSVHHQGVKELGENLDILATSKEDQIIEAFKWNQCDAGKVMGVQWHPEFFHNSKEPVIDANSIYRLFLDFC
ncbi:MAG TPA: hypothetical protein EYN51_09835, partial [Flavobacteriales bacterium]|nr:hypothetical protein [Flavobacteriales bacterium]